MPRRKSEQPPIRGIFEKPALSDIWWIRYTDGQGKYRREKVGRRSDAITLYQKRKNDARIGIKLHDNLRHRKVTFKVLAEHVIEFAKAHHSQIRDTVARVDKLLPEFGDREADSIKPSEIDRWLIENTKTPATANRYRSTISLMYREAMRNDRVSTNPARLVRMRPENNARIRFITDEEKVALTKIVRSKWPHKLCELTVSLGTGMRLSEQYSLTWAQVDFIRKIIKLTKTKNGTGRDIPMNKSVYDAFRELHGLADDKSSGGLAFPKGLPRKWFEQALKDAAIENYRWHDNRHSFCSRLAMAGRTIKEIQELAGHKTITMAARYSHLDEKTLRSAVDAIG